MTWHEVHDKDGMYTPPLIVGVIADGHRPIYTTSIGDGVVSVAQALRNSLEPLLLKYQVSTFPIFPCFRDSPNTCH